MQATENAALPGERAPVIVNVDRWRAGLPPDAWPDTFPANGEIWRRDVFAVADAYRAGSASACQLLTAVLVWGYGPIGYGPWRTARSLDCRSGRQTPGVRAGRGFHARRRTRPRWVRRTADSATLTTHACPGWGRACSRRSSTSSAIGAAWVVCSP